MKILFITHDSSRTGAPMVLLYFLQWLNTNKPEVQIDVLALRGGELKDDFKKNCLEFYDFQELLKYQKLSLAKRVLKKLNLFKPINKEVLLLGQLSAKAYDIVYANSVLSVPVACKIVGDNIKVKFLAHIHELETVIKQEVPEFKQYVEKIDCFIAVSKMVANILKESYFVLEQRINVIYECAEIEKTEKISEVNKTFKVGAAGSVNWRKGYDLFIQVARYVNKNYPEANIEFEWVGKISPFNRIIVDEDIKKLGLKERLKFTGELEEPIGRFKSFDVFVMTSREDPFPLVCIEVGALGKPIISFEHAIGTNEVLANGGGFIVPYLDVETMGNKVIDYYKNHDLLKSHGSKNIKLFSEFSPEIICPMYFSLIENLCDG
ncbi:glycosyltransferase [Thalassobellus suaedae]|uniref:Glycosyltransferase n=1 Tax=Thalassobellus suaedae TaxID=3074124 RepID=A0ABY9XUJ6_9FLAO|nr:glycosyltransferase [Flavobacteriaceae bacterium HL-DH14]